MAPEMLSKTHKIARPGIMPTRAIACGRLFHGAEPLHSLLRRNLMQHADSCYRVKMISAVSVNGNRPCPIPDMCPQGYFIPDESTRSAKQASHPMAPRGAGSWLNGHGHLSGRMHAAQDSYIL
jgi:hypothetical protein